MCVCPSAYLHLRRKRSQFENQWRRSDKRHKKEKESLMTLYPQREEGGERLALEEGGNVSSTVTGREMRTGKREVGT